MTGRLGIDDVTPTVGDGHHPSKAVVGELTHSDDGLGVSCELGEPGGRDLAQHADGVVPAALPGLGIERGEQVLRGRMPRPPQVHRKGLQRLERRGQLGADGEATQGSHGPQRTGSGQVIDSADRGYRARSVFAAPGRAAVRVPHVKIT